MIFKKDFLDAIYVVLILIICNSFNFVFAETAERNKAREKSVYSDALAHKNEIVKLNLIINKTIEKIIENKLDFPTIIIKENGLQKEISIVRSELCYLKTRVKGKDADDLFIVSVNFKDIFFPINLNPNQNSNQNKNVHEKDITHIKMLRMFEELNARCEAQIEYIKEINLLNTEKFKVKTKDLVNYDLDVERDVDGNDCLRVKNFLQSNTNQLVSFMKDEHFSKMFFEVIDQMKKQIESKKKEKQEMQEQQVGQEKDNKIQKIVINNMLKGMVETLFSEMNANPQYIAKLRAVDLREMFETINKFTIGNGPEVGFLSAKFLSELANLINFKGIKLQERILTAKQMEKKEDLDYKFLAEYLKIESDILLVLKITMKNFLDKKFSSEESRRLRDMISDSYKRIKEMILVYKSRSRDMFWRQMLDRELQDDGEFSIDGKWSEVRDIILLK
ncbi:MAG: hypothetical protein HQK49_21005 [Oligoflexia bacterium]|nr:hypothetical protein [Oligoflexia bacterium]